MPKVSVIIPVYNVEKYLRQCLDSVINQTLEDIEIICVDDKSTDGSLQILKEYAEKDARIIILEQCNNQGQGIARNMALDIAKGEYIMFLDSDDWYELEACERAYNQIKQNNNDVCLFNHSEFWQDSQEKTMSNFMIKPYLQYLCNSKIFFKDLDIDFMKAMYSCVYIYEKSFINKIRFSDDKIGEDIIFLTQIFSSKNANFSIIQEPLYNYRRYMKDKNSNSSSMDTNKWKYVFKTREQGLKIINETKCQNLINAFLIYYIRSVMFWYTKFIKKDKSIEKDYYLSMKMAFISLQNNYDIDKIKSYIDYKKFTRIIKQGWTLYSFSKFLKNIFSIENRSHSSEKQKILKIFGIKITIRINESGKFKFLEKFLSIKNTDNKQRKIITILGFKIKVKKFISLKDKENYIKYVCNHQLDKSNFVPICENKYKQNNVKPIAFYLPQYHDFKENVKWFGRGFTEWSNTSKAVPQYIGHWQPHIPIDVGYYNLDTVKPMHRQIELAKNYGIYGFSFYYYWFSGEKLMEKPLERFLADKSLDMPFFLFWANEDWTMLWDNGNEKEILHKQVLKEDDAEKFMMDALPYFMDNRYIKIDNKPLLIIYDPNKYALKKFIEFNKKIRQIAKDNGFDDLYILTTTLRLRESIFGDLTQDANRFVETYMLDGIFEFFPQSLTSGRVERKYEKIMNNRANIRIFDICKFIKNKNYIYDCSANLFKGCFPNWDNTPRKCYNNATIFQNTPQDYKKWLMDIIKWTKEHKREEEQFVFINAWNEWAEGAHLEPDQKYGYAYLQATKEALEESVGL